MTIPNEFAVESAYPESRWEVSPTDTYLEFLRGLPVFANLDEESLERIAARLIHEQFFADELIFNSGDPSDSLYFILEGAVTLFDATVGKPTRLVARIGPGDMFGEMGLLEQGARTASARALETTRVLKLVKRDFSELVATHPSLILKFTLEALSRFSANLSRLADPRTREDPRVSVGRIVRFEWEPGHSRHVSLENLSAGGMCLRGVVCPFGLNESFSGTLRLVYGHELLRFEGRVAWRQDHAMGIAFTNVGANHESTIRAVLRQLLPVSPSSRAPR